MSFQHLVARNAIERHECCWDYIGNQEIRILPPVARLGEISTNLVVATEIFQTLANAGGTTRLERL